ncbi:putative F-box/kelch-repeat protein [Raphanus sativus]|nr:putative F-box/kelch-repeat protein [Raphanus sativus]
MMSDIPQDLIEEILSRVPAASLRRLRSTCKLWNDLFKDGRFRENHIRKAPKQSRILMLNDYKISSLNVNLNVAPPAAVEFKGPLVLKDSHSCSQQVDIEDIFHCDGLLLCTIRNDRHRLMVWNPYLGETRWIQIFQTTTNSSSDLRYSFALGYQNNNFCRSSRILKCWHSIDPMMVFEVYELSSGSWRVFDDIALDCCILPKCGVSFKGNAYWLAFGQTVGLLLGFDFTRDTFIRLCLPQAMEFCYLNLSVVN